MSPVSASRRCTRITGLSKTAASAFDSGRVRAGVDGAASRSAVMNDVAFSTCAAVFGAASDDGASDTFLIAIASAFCCRLVVSGDGGGLPADVAGIARDGDAGGVDTAAAAAGASEIAAGDPGTAAVDAAADSDAIGDENGAGATAGAAAG
eukprot:24793-Pelagococcus_subviridis.AAC.1